MTWGLGFGSQLLWQAAHSTCPWRFHGSSRFCRHPYTFDTHNTHIHTQTHTDLPDHNPLINSKSLNCVTLTSSTMEWIGGIQEQLLQPAQSAGKQWLLWCARRCPLLSFVNVAFKEKMGGPRRLCQQWAPWHVSQISCIMLSRALSWNNGIRRRSLASFSEDDRLWEQTRPQWRRANLYLICRNNSSLPIQLACTGESFEINNFLFYY